MKPVFLPLLEWGEVIKLGKAAAVTFIAGALVATLGLIAPIANAVAAIVVGVISKAALETLCEEWKVSLSAPA